MMVTLTPPDLNPEGIVPMDWVRKINARTVGQVESITDDYALVDWLNGKEVVCCIYLRRIEGRGHEYDKRRR